MTAALVAIFCLVLGVVFGLLFGRATNAPYQQAQELKDSLQQVQYEYDTYKAEVTQHFTKTAELVNTMTDNYRSVHTHLAGGAQTLCAGAPQLESMNGKEALEAQAEEVKETSTSTTEAVSSNEAAANEEITAESTEASSETDNEVETIKVDAETATVETKTESDAGTDAKETNGVEAKPEQEVTPELLADAAASEQKQSEGRIH